MARVSPWTRCWREAIRESQADRGSPVQKHGGARPRVQVRFRRDQGLFGETLGLNAILTFRTLQCELPMAEIYRNVDFALAS